MFDQPNSGRGDASPAGLAGTIYPYSGDDITNNLVVSQSIEHSLQRVSGQLVLGETKIESSDAPLPLPEICAAAMRLRKADKDRYKATLDARWPDSRGLVDTTRTGAPIDPRNFLRSFARRCDPAGVRRIRVHDTRHTCGSMLAALDVHPRVAMQILRHSKIDVTMEIYTHVPSALTRRALKELGDSFGDLASWRRLLL